VTEDSRDTAPGYGPFHAGAESSAHPMSQDPAATGPVDKAQTIQPEPSALFDPAPWDISTSRPRIEPSPPPDRRRLLLGVLAGLATGLIVFGAAGFATGRATAKAPKPPAPTLPLFEQTQQTLNRPKFPPALAPIAQSWLPYLSACARNGDPGGPVLNQGEKAKIRCAVSGMSAIFIEYATPADWNKSRTTAQDQNAAARTLTPGVEPPAGTGGYVEYAYRITEGKIVRTVSAIRWDDSRAPVAGYLLAYWTDGVGWNWAPMRDLWGRYA
jgi:hypothetical protein